MLRRSTFLAAVIVAAVPSRAQDNMTRIKVEVLSHGGKPIDRAAVIVDFVKGRSIAKLGKKLMTHWEVRTNQDGIAKVPALPQGNVRVQVVAKGFQTFGDVYEVTEPEKTITIRLNPPQPQHSEHQ
jgi:uncharacterized lipoprotein YmbA